MTEKNEKPNIRFVRRENRSVIFEFENCKPKLYSLAKFAEKYRATFILDKNMLTFVFSTEIIAKEVAKQWDITN